MRHILNTLKGRIRSIRNKLWFAMYTGSTPPPQKIWDSQWKAILDYLSSEENEAYHYEIFYDNLEHMHKWVGGVYFQNKIIGIASSGRDCLVIDLEKNTVARCGKLPEGTFKWSGGCVWNDCIYGFPRTSLQLLCFSPKEDGNVKYKSLDVHYTKEHHYGGVCTKEGIVYQPPRSTNSILKIDLNTGAARELWISKNKKKLRYCGSVLHPNGLIYFLPEYMERVMVLDPKDDRIYFIGKCITSMVFGACVAPDGNIYGYSAYNTGILMIDVKANTTKMLFSDTSFGCYGSALGIHGKILGIPGNGKKIFEFDPLTKKLSVLAELPDDSHESCAGSAMAPDGSIYCIPAKGTRLYVLRPERKHRIPKEIIESGYLNNCY